MAPTCPCSGTVDPTRASAPVAFLVVTLLIGGCCLGCEAPHSRTNTAGEISTRILDREMEQALAELGRSRAVLPTDLAEAERSLDAACRSLLRLRDYYLPLIRARVGAHDAGRWLSSGDRQRALEELATIQSVLLSISEREDVSLSREIDSPLQILVEARAAVTAGRPESAALVERFGARIDLLLARGELALGGTELGDG